MNWRRIACARLVRGPVLILLTVGLYTVLAVYVFGLEIYKLAFTPTYKDDMLQQNPYALPHCGNRQISPDLRLLRQLQWVHPQAMSYPRVEPEPGKASEEMLPLIFYDKRLAYHPTFMEGCEFRCRFTSNLTQLNRSQLVVFTSNPSPDERLYAGDIPWAFESAEPLHRMPWLSEEVKKRFSMFITYHPYASIPYYYGIYRAFLNPECVMSEAQRKRLRAQNSLHLLPVHHFRKTKKVAWAVSDNEPFNNRTILGNAIAKYIEVDKYGRKAKYCPLAGLCFEHLSRNYKFYLSFENANCEGYITEKFFVNALGYGMVPIVYGASREEFYARAPPNSYIHVDEFKTVADLAKYLNYLDKNDTAYASYFAWKEHGEVLTWLRVDCRVCGVLHHVLSGRLKLYDGTFRSYLDASRTCTNTSKIQF